LVKIKICFQNIKISEPQQESLLQSSTPKKVDKLGAEIISQLRQIQGLNLESDIFVDPVFNYLKDYSKEIQPEDSGRSNPFAPLGTDDVVEIPEVAPADSVETESFQGGL
jgi:hypothetical protein